MYFDETLSNTWNLDKALDYYNQRGEDVSAVYQIVNDLNTVIHSRPNYTVSSCNKAKELLETCNKKWPKKLRTKGKEAEHVRPILVNKSNITINSTENTSIINTGADNKRKHIDVTPSPSQKKVRSEDNSLYEYEALPIEEDERIWEKWIKFIKEVQNKPNLHEFACERHGILRLGRGITNTNLGDDDYNDLKHWLLEKDGNCIPDVIENVEFHLYELFDKMDNEDFFFNIRWPEIKSKDSDYLSKIQLIHEITVSVYNFSYRPNLAASLEQSYRDVLTFPLLKACVNMMNNDNLMFIPGEVPLKSMTAQLTNLKKVLAPNEKYYADGVISYLNNNDICIYEASGPFDSKDKSKQNFDFHKAVFGLLSCTATIAQSYKYASVKTFSKLKLYFIQTKGSSIHLWYLRHLRENTYAIVRESKLIFSNKKEKYADTVLDCLQFAGLFKKRLTNTMHIIDALISEHNKTSIMQRTSRDDIESPPPLLSTVIKPAIIKLTESKHCKEMHKLGPDSFLE